MAKDKKKLKVSFQFTALQKRIKLLNAKVLLLEEKNRRLEAEAREEWRHEASQESVPASEDTPSAVSESELAQKPWYKRILGL